MTPRFSITDQPNAEITKLGKALGAFNDRDVGPADKRPLAVLAHDADQQLIAGVSGYTGWGWLYIQWLWVDAAQRGQGIAGDVLRQAETEARARGCRGAHIDTFSPVALRVYQRHGYEVFGEIPDFVAGRTRSFLSKRLDGPAP
ncbi:MAG: GNAT family N-acetyltransferase [Marinosulfonomonas sp.]